VSALCISGFLCSWVGRAYMLHRLGLVFGIMQWPFSRLDGLFLGAFIAIYREMNGRSVSLGWAASSFIAGAVILLWIAVAHPAELGNGYGLDIWRSGVTAFALMSGGLIAATQHPVSWLHRVLTVRPLLVAGRLSYGMYIYHLLIYRILVHLRHHLFAPSTGPTSNVLEAMLYLALAVLVVTGLAELSFRFIETPFLRLKRFFPSPAARVS
jgi:peptidoglycan/LPS O-acetylase OafA/YrhL